MTSSPLCHPEAAETMLDLGLQPVCSHFQSMADNALEQYSLTLSLCNETGLVFLGSPFPVDTLVPRFEWIRYNEPEDHLNHMAATISRLPGLTERSAICGVSYKDDSTLTRLEPHGFSKLWRIDPVHDLEISSLSANIESIQYALTRERAKKIAQHRGKVDVLIARHILEHANDPHEFIGALRELVAPGGYLVIEVPDCQRSLEIHDYTMVWEEHTLYFTEQTFRTFTQTANLSPLAMERHPYPFEDSLVGYFSISPPPPVQQDRIESELIRARDYGVGFTAYREKVRSFFRRHAPDKIAIFGAGHLTCTYINFFGIKDHIKFVVDDDANKQGLRMAGSGLPILPSSALEREGIGLCLLGVNPLAEQNVIPRLARSVGGVYSIFPGSPHYLFNSDKT